MISSAIQRALAAVQGVAPPIAVASNVAADPVVAPAVYPVGRDQVTSHSDEDDQYDMLADVYVDGDGDTPVAAGKRKALDSFTDSDE